MDYDFNKVLTNLGCGLQQYCERNNIKSLVLGISGGIDSTLTAAIAKLVADAVDIPLYGVSMPTVTNASEEKRAANMVGNAFCDAFMVPDSAMVVIAILLPLNMLASASADLTSSTKSL